MIERKIIIGLITSTEYLQQLRSIWDVSLLESTMAKQLSTWCWEYFNRYDKAPGKNIEGIYFAKLKEGKLNKDLFSEIEESILPGLSKEYENENFNLEYLWDETQRYLSARHIQIYSETLQALNANGQITEAEELACSYKPLSTGKTEGLNLTSTKMLSRIDKAFVSTNQGLIQYNGALGEFWNSQFVKGGFVALMASEKRGKTFWLMDIAMMASKRKHNVAFIQAGDMTEDQQLKRFCIYHSKKSDKKRYCEEHYEPIRDCIKNQLNDCRKKERRNKSCPDGVFEGCDEKEIKYGITLDQLVDSFKDNSEHEVCYHCDEYIYNSWGATWIKFIPEVEPLTAEEAKKAMSKFFLHTGRHFKLSTHANGTLSVKQIRALLGVWEKQDGFIPDVIIIDYADLLVAEGKEFRHQQNEIWKGLRTLSQEKGQPLVITATQADAKSYEADRLKLSNFSEDKRKYAHVTAMYGLNQDKENREKKIGIMRINEIVIREGEFSSTNEVTVLQNLKRGMPHISSFR